MRTFLRPSRRSALVLAALSLIACGQAVRATTTAGSAAGTGGSTSHAAGTGGSTSHAAGTGGGTSHAAGTGGMTGTGGGGLSCGQSPVCGAQLCGNGVRDTCQANEPGCGPTTPGCPITEDCDGTTLGGATCASLAFAGGVLGCNADCTFDTSQCVDCAGGPQVTACGRMSFASRVASVGMTTNDSAIGLAWTSDCAGGGTGSLHFATVDASFSLVSSSTLVTSFPADPPLPTPSVAATPNGWLVALNDLFVLDPKGVVLSTRANAGGVLVQRKGGGPLLLWLTPGATTTQASLHAVILAADGSEATTPVTMTTTATGTPAGTFVGDGFLVAVGTTAPAIPPAGGLQVFHVGLDGSVTTGAAIPASQALSARLAWNGTSARLTYVGFYTSGMASQPGTFWQSLAGDGSLLGTRVQIDLPGNQNYYGASPIATSGDSSLVVLGPDTGEGARQLWVTELDASGQTKLAAFDLNRDPCATGAAITTLGSTAVVAWAGGRSCGYDGGGITLARVVPVP